MKGMKPVKQLKLSVPAQKAPITSFLIESLESLSSSELVDNTTSSSSTSSNYCPLYELSGLMAHLPVKRGLSKYYQGKSESFGSLANLSNFEDLGKSSRSRKSTKSLFRSFGGGQSETLGPKCTIVKNKSSLSSIARSSLFSTLGDMNSLLDTISVQNHF